MAIVLPGLSPRERCSRIALGGLNGVDQLTFAHRASALDSKGAGQLLQLGEDHGVQAGALAIATITGELLTLLAGAFLIVRRHSSLRRFLSTCVSFVGFGHVIGAHPWRGVLLPRPTGLSRGPHRIATTVLEMWLTGDAVKPRPRRT